MKRRGRMRAAERLEVVLGDARGRPVRMTGLSTWLKRVAPTRARGRVGVALVSDHRVRSLNRRYRRQDHATDVLSFPPDATGHASDRLWLGEIVIARGVARRQARTAGHSELTELRVLALHGLLHLLGYDHERDRGHGRKRRGVPRKQKREGGLRRDGDQSGDGPVEDDRPGADPP